MGIEDKIDEKAKQLQEQAKKAEEAKLAEQASKIKSEPDDSEEEYYEDNDPEDNNPPPFDALKQFQETTKLNKKYPGLFPILPQVNLDPMKELQHRLNDMSRPDEYEEETIDLIQGPVGIKLVRRKYSFRNGYNYTGTPGESIYVTIGGEEKKVYEKEAEAFALNSLNISDKIIDNIVLSPDREKIAFDAVDVKDISFLMFSGYGTPKVRNVYVVNVDGSDKLEIKYPSQLDIELPKQECDTFNWDDLDFMEKQRIINSVKNSKTDPGSLYGTISSSNCFFDPQFTKNNVLQIKGEHLYSRPSRQFELSTCNGYSPTSGPIQLISIVLDSQNNIKKASVIG